ncbi:hypothetical protein VP01_2039g5 [Puccinia sorghi]|uniref:No apical meristem-associated C-terminal domain-containing protein n=1 Tax=Puccinia sorghi TaxID=27349 RepID=A0A0L6VBK8_9BASI|nr:hypothetical protein VP01_2039g5 [Puccinia sorghi]
MFCSSHLKKVFNHLNFYNILSAAPKWNKYCSDLEQKQKTADSKKHKQMPSTSEAPLSIPSTPAPSSKPGEALDQLSGDTLLLNTSQQTMVI